MLLTFLSGMPITMSAAYAQTTTPTTVPAAGSTDFFSSIANSTLGQVASGQTSITNAAQTLATNTIPGGATAAQYQSVLTNLMNGQNINAQSAIGIVGGLMSGSVSGPLGTALSTVKNLGNITTLDGLKTALSGPLGTALSSITGSTLGTTAQNLLNQSGALGTALTAVLGKTGAAALLSNPVAAAGVQALISKVAPGLSNLLTPAGLTAALTQLGTQIAGAVGGVVGGLIGGLLGAGSPLAAATATATGQAASAAKKACMPENSPCVTAIPDHYLSVRDTVTKEFQAHQLWFVNTYWKQNILPALMLMAEQLTVAGIHQIEIFGTLLDAKHQLETQRLFQELTAQAHKDYQPSEGMCTFGTTVRSLAASQRKSDVSQVAFAQRMSQRQVMAGDVTSVEGVASDMRSRMQKFISTYCDQADDSNGLGKLCPAAVPTASRRNIDVDYTRNVESRLTLDMDIAPTGTAAAAATAQTPDAEDVFALSANLYSHNIAPRLQPELLGDGKGKIRMSAAEKYMDLRAIFAKRSVAQNSFAAMTAMRASGDEGSAPYTKALIKELGIQDTADIEKLLGKKPSYFAQMEVLTKKLYQNPVFYTELYDKPVNVERKTAAMQAIGLMQDRDLYNSLLRSEAVLSVLLETMLQKEQEKVTNAQNSMGRSGGAH